MSHAQLMSVTFTSLDALVPFARLRAQRTTCDGRDTLSNRLLIEACTHYYKLFPDVLVTVLFTRDVGHHSSGWWKNPDYERCWHLSLSFHGLPTHEPLPFDRKEAEKIVRAFFNDEVRRVWTEAPFSERGKANDVWHYRLFADAGWQPITPRHEVYSKEFTQTGWKSFSELHCEEPRP